MPLQTGQVLNERYRIVRMLGQNVCGAVYRAWDINLRGPRVLRESCDTSPTAMQQFAVDASRLANLRHPALPKVSDYFSLPGMGQYLVVEFIEGQDLQEKIEWAGGPIPEGQSLPWITQVCEALDYLHNLPQPIFHSDLNPGDIRITPDDRVVLVDFGLSALYDPIKRSDPAMNALMPGYAPLERYGQQPADARTVVYALGAIAYHLLSGNKPCDSLERVAEDALTPLRQLVPGISPEVETAVMKALAVGPDERWQSIVDFKNALSGAQSTLKRGQAPADTALPTVQLHPTPLDVLPVEPAPAATVAVEPAFAEPVEPAYAEPEAAEPASAEPASAGTTYTEPAPEPPFSASEPFPAPAAAVVLPAQAEPAPPKKKFPWALLIGGVGLLLVLVCVAAGVVAYRQGIFGIGPATDTPEAEALAPTDTLVKPTRTRSATATATEVPATATTTLAPTATATPLPPTATPTRAPEIFADALGVKMALIPAGEFSMGSSGYDRPAHTVYLDEYTIDIYEVTNARYAECVKAGKCPIKPRCTMYSDPVFANYAVVCVNWSQAQAYCEWRGGSLPTEAQWEKAARGGLEGKLYPWGDEAPTCERGAANGAQYLACEPHNPAPVGSFSANGYGLYDMAGNVWEWAWDWYQDTYYTASPAQNPTGPESGKYRVSRGGSWYLEEGSMQNAFRGWSDPTSWGVYVGFRCAGKK